jgi:hypothetical protein
LCAEFFQPCTKIFGSLEKLLEYRNYVGKEKRKKAQEGNFKKRRRKFIKKNMVMVAG